MNPDRGLIGLGGKVFRLSARGRYQIDIAARDSLIAHQSADKRDLIAGGRPAGDGDLQTVQRTRGMFRVENGLWLAVRQRLGIELRHPPVVFPGRGCGDIRELPGVGRPVIFVDMKVGRGYLTKFTGGGFDARDALDLQSLDPDYASGRLHGRERPSGPGGAFDIQAGNVQAVGRKGKGGDSTVQMREAPGDSAGGRRCGYIDVRLFPGAGGGIAVGGKGE